MEKKIPYVRTTVYLPKTIHFQAKMIAHLTGKTLSMLMKMALIKEINAFKPEK